MERILWIAHTEPDGSLSKISLETLNAAISINKALSGSVLLAGIIGGSVKSAGDRIAECKADVIYTVEGSDFSQSRAVSDTAAVTAIVEQAQATIVIAPTDSRFARVMPAVTARLKGRIDTKAVQTEVVDGALRIKRWFYRQRMIGTLSRTARPWFILMDSGSAEAYNGVEGSAELTPVSVNLPTVKTTVIGMESATTGEQTIKPDADLLFVAGAGWTKKQADGQTHVAEAEQLIKTFITKAGASLGSSKSLVDQAGEGQSVISFLTHLNQVGQTGATPRHPKGLATCCHGEEPHVVGWRFVNERRAVNLDPNCGWAQGKADVVYVADAFAVMKKVTELLSQ